MILRITFIFIMGRVMDLKKERQVFREYIATKGLKQSAQRDVILEVFLKSEKHLTSDELYGMSRRRLPSIGHATVYRTLRLLCECGLCRGLKLEDGVTRYEHLYGHEHHDHLICTKCGKFVEVVDPEIEKLQEKLAKANGFVVKRHRLELYGTCKECRT